MSETPVKQRLDESLSALIDGEVSELELRRLLKASDEEFTELRARWLSYHASRDAIKQDIPSVPFQDISAGISAAIAEEETYSSQPSTVKTDKRSMWSGVGRFAIAASVAGAVVLGVQFSPNDVDGGQFAGSSSTSGLTTGTVAPLANTDPSKIPSSFLEGLPADTSVRTVSNEPLTVQKEQKNIVISESTQQQLQQVEDDVNRLMLEHAQNASQNTQQGVLPYARVPESLEKQ